MEKKTGVKSTEIVATPEIAQGIFSAENLISKAIEKNVPIETMEKLLQMRSDLRKEWAKEQFDAAMASFQGECPVIKKSKDGGKTRSGSVAYKYAPLDDIVEQVKNTLWKNGFSYIVRTEVPDGKVKVTCIVKHKAGHSEETNVEMPLTTKTDIMSAPQQVAATLTFAKRYAFCNAFGIMTGDEDTDAPKTEGSVPVEKMSEYQIAIMKTRNMEELKTIWASLPLEAKQSLAELKETLKKQHENS